MEHSLFESALSIWEVYLVVVLVWCDICVFSGGEMRITGLCNRVSSICSPTEVLASWFLDNHGTKLDYGPQEGASLSVFNICAMIEELLIGPAEFAELSFWHSWIVKLRIWACAWSVTSFLFTVLLIACAMQEAYALQRSSYFRAGLLPDLLSIYKCMSTPIYRLVSRSRPNLCPPFRRVLLGVCISGLDFVISLLSTMVNWSF